jgi:Arc/MetJ-type ribon-helix-helix transcriptional regulator
VAVGVSFDLQPTFAYLEGMVVELKPEQERKIQQQLASGQFRSVDEVLTAALDRLSGSDSYSDQSAVERLIEFSRTHSVKLPVGQTVDALVREIRDSQ